MITVRKLRSLKDGTRFRKYIIILQELESNLINQKHIETVYFNSILHEISQEKSLPERVIFLSTQGLNLYNINNLRHNIMTFLDMEPSEWDFTAPLDKEKKKIISGRNLYLEDIRSPFNLGSLFRSAECFAVDKIYLSKDCTSPNHNRAQRTSMGCINIVDWEQKNLDNIKLPVFALELGGIPIDEFDFPLEGICIIGSEELGVSPLSLKIADQSLGRVSIPLFGSKSSLNVANATAILLQRWSENNLKS